MITVAANPIQLAVSSQLGNPGDLQVLESSDLDFARDVLRGLDAPREFSFSLGGDVPLSPLATQQHDALHRQQMPQGLQEPGRAPHEASAEQSNRDWSEFWQLAGMANTVPVPPPPVATPASAPDSPGTTAVGTTDNALLAAPPADLKSSDKTAATFTSVKQTWQRGVLSAPFSAASAASRTLLSAFSWRISPRHPSAPTSLADVLDSPAGLAHLHDHAHASALQTEPLETAFAQQPVNELNHTASESLGEAAHPVPDSQVNPQTGQLYDRSLIVTDASPAHMEVSFNSPEVGEVWLQVRQGDQGVEAHFETQASTTMKILQDSLAAIRERVESIGVELGTLSFGFRQEEADPGYAPWRWQRNRSQPATGREAGVRAVEMPARVIPIWRGQINVLA